MSIDGISEELRAAIREWRDATASEADFVARLQASRDAYLKNAVELEKAFNSELDALNARKREATNLVGAACQKVNVLRKQLTDAVEGSA